MPNKKQDTRLGLIIIAAIVGLVVLSFFTDARADNVIVDQGTWPTTPVNPADYKQTLNFSAKFGALPEGVNNSAPDVTGFILAVQAKDCGNHCISPFITHVRSKSDRNTGLGVDYIYKPVNTPRHEVEIGVGLVQFTNRLNEGEYTNFHLSIALKIHTSKRYALQLGIDHFSNGRKVFDRSNVERNLPTNMVVLGVAF